MAGDLTEVRALVESITGRRNLVLDNSALVDRVINRACRWLESVQDTPVSRRRHFFKLASGAFEQQVPYLRAVLEVWASNGANRHQLDFADFDEVRAEGRISSFTAGAPVAYSVAVSKLSPSQEDAVEGDFVAAGYDADAYADIVFGMSDTVQNVVVLPPSDGSWTFDLLGKFWPRLLVYSDGSGGPGETNWWTVNSPMSVAYAACAFLEMERRNEAGAREFIEAARLGLREIDHQLIEAELGPYDRPDGSGLYLRG